MDIFSEIDSLVSGFHAIQRVAAAGVTLLVYDHLLTFGEEVRLIWPARWTVSKSLFLYNRYATTISLVFVNSVLSGFHPPLNSEICAGWIVFQATAAIFGLASTNYLVLGRVAVLWRHNRRVLVPLLVLFWVVHIATFAVTGVVASQLAPMVNYNTLFSTCAVFEIPRLLAFTLGIPLIFTLAVFVLTCWNALDRPRNKATPLILQTLYKDGLVYFLILGSFGVTGLVMLERASIVYSFATSYLSWPMSVMLSARLVLNIRAVEVVDANQSLDMHSYAEQITIVDPIDYGFKDDADITQYAIMPGKYAGRGRVWNTRVATFLPTMSP